MLSTEVTFIMPTTSNEPSRTLVESDTQNYRALIHDLVTTVFHLIALFSLLLSYFYTYLSYQVLSFSYIPLEGSYSYLSYPALTFYCIPLEGFSCSK